MLLSNFYDLKDVFLWLIHNDSRAPDMRLRGRHHVSTQEYNEVDEVPGIVQLLLYINIIIKYPGLISLVDT